MVLRWSFRFWDGRGIQRGAIKSWICKCRIESVAQEGFQPEIEIQTNHVKWMLLQGPTLSTSTSSFEALDPHDPQVGCAWFIHHWQAGFVFKLFLPVEPACLHYVLKDCRLDRWDMKNATFLCLFSCGNCFLLLSSAGELESTSAEYQLLEQMNRWVISA